MDALTLVKDLSTQGVKFRWTARGMAVTGDVGRLTLDYRHALKANLAEVEALVKWQALQDESVRRFGHPGAALYPFCRLTDEQAPIVRTTEGPARVSQVLPESVRVVLETDREKWLEAADKTKPLRMVELQFDQVFPPATPPEGCAMSRSLETAHQPECATSRKHEVAQGVGGSRVPSVTAQKSGKLPRAKNKNSHIKMGGGISVWESDQ